tara:strand:+ start:12089 stop:14446 length:2358 start_codon:yes stop_codon:yes gene_type:complete
MTRIISLLFLLVSTISYSQNYSKVKIYANSQEMSELASLGLPVDHGERKAGTFIISDFSDEQIEIIKGSGFQYEILIEDVQHFYITQNSLKGSEKNITCEVGSVADLPQVPVNFDTDPNSYAGMYRYQEMLAELDAMAVQYPSLITVKAPISTFQTWEGRPIYQVKISDNASTNESAEPKVLYTSIHHAREPLSMSETIFFMWYLLENYGTNEEIQFLVNNTEMYFVPCVNPDGYIRNETTDVNGGGMHRKNMRSVGTSNPGVDLNRNYSYGWNTTGVSSDPDSDIFPGPSAFSEPETQAIQWLVESINFTSAFNAHTYGKTLLYPIGTTATEFADHNDYFAAYAAHMTSKNGYFPQKSSGLYPASGDSDDYMYKVDIGVGQKDTIFVITPEVGSSFWPSATEVIPTCQEMVFSNKILAHITHLYLAVSETDPNALTTMTGNFNHDVQRLGLISGGITVSIDPLLNVQSVGTPIVYNLSIKETSSGTISYSLNPSIQFGDEIKYILKTEYPTWTMRDTITKIYGTPTLQFSDDAGTSLNWTGSWSLTSSDFVSSPTSFTESANGNYSDNATDSYELIQSIDLTNATSAQVSFYAKWQIEADYDYCQFQVSTDGGSTWAGQCGTYTVAGSSTTWNGSVQPDGEPVYEGTQSNWVLEEINMSDYLGQSLKIRFIFESDGGVNQDGFYFDDFKVAFTNSNVGLEENKIEVKLFPNPAKSEVVISTSNPINNGKVLIFDQSGRSVVEKAINNQLNQLSVDLSNFREGIYTVHIINDAFVSEAVKLVVIH